MDSMQDILDNVSFYPTHDTPFYSSSDVNDPKLDAQIDYYLTQLHDDDE